MAKLNQIINGLKGYLEEELLPRVSGYQKWIVGAGVNLLLDKGVNVFNLLKENPLIKSMEIINSEDEIDLERLYNAFLSEARKSAVTFSVPLVGAVTLKETDIEKIYQKIKENR